MARKIAMLIAAIVIAPIALVLIIAALPFLLIISWNNEHKNRFLRRHMKNIASFQHISGKKGRTFILLPGILARSQEQFSGLIPDFLEKGSVATVDYQGRGFDLRRSVSLIAEITLHYIKQGERVTIVGASLGGLVAYKVRVKLSTISDMDIIMIDTPCGTKTMKAFPDGLGWIFKVLPSSPLPEKLGNWILMKMRVPPKDHNIDIPEGVEDQGEWIDGIKDEAMTNLSGHSFVRYYEQLKAMVNTRPSPSARNLDAIYVSCVSPENDVVAQPLASKLWSAMIETSNVEIDGNHCGFLEQQPRWSSLLDNIL